MDGVSGIPEPNLFLQLECCHRLSNSFYNNNIIIARLFIWQGCDLANDDDDDNDDDDGEDDDDNDDDDDDGDDDDNDDDGDNDDGDDDEWWW